MKLDIRRKLPLAFASLAITTATLTQAQDGTFAASNVIAGVRQYIYDTDGTTFLPKSNGAVQFVLNGTVLGAGTYGLFIDGIFSAGVIRVPGLAGNVVTIGVDVWDKSTGATYAIASASGHFMPEQSVTIILGGAGGGVPATASPLAGFIGGKLIAAPEPSTLALVALGLGGLIFLARRR